MSDVINFPSRTRPEHLGDWWWENLSCEFPELVNMVADDDEVAMKLQRLSVQAYRLRQEVAVVRELLAERAEEVPSRYDPVPHVEIFGDRIAILADSLELAVEAGEVDLAGVYQS